MSALRNARSMRESIAILASQSPDRLSLLRQIGIEPRVIVSNFEENLSEKMPVDEFVVGTALGKLNAVVTELRKSQTAFDVVVAADTVIYHNKRIIGKPKDDEDARQTINSLSGTSHDVYTGLALYYSDGSTVSLAERTTVTFRHLPTATIDAYIASGGHRGMAGSYGIQSGGAILVKEIAGCFSNIVGLPLGRLSEELEKKRFIL